MSKLRFNFILLITCYLYSWGVAAQATPELLLTLHKSDVLKLNISALPEEIGTLNYEYLAVFVENEAKEYVSSRAMQGEYTKEGKYLIFKPYFPFEDGLHYVVRTKKTATTAYSYYPLQVGKKAPIANAKVVSIYPSSTQLPENLLRFYIYFNTPMKKGQALNHIQ